LILSTSRFITMNRLLQSESTESYGIRSVVALGIVFILLAVFVLIYISRLSLLS
jgi:hypothetical protein